MENKKQDNIKSFNVIRWDINTSYPVSYDVIPFFVREYDEKRKGKKPKTFEEFTEFVKSAGNWNYRYRCEYEVILSEFDEDKVETKETDKKRTDMYSDLIVSPWPPSDRENAFKIDVWMQIEANLELVTRIVMDACLDKKRTKK